MSDPYIQSIPGLNADQIETRAYRGILRAVGIKHADSRIQGTYSCQLFISTRGQQSSQTAINYIAFEGNYSKYETPNSASFLYFSYLSLTLQLVSLKLISTVFSSFIYSLRVWLKQSLLEISIFLILIIIIINLNSIFRFII
jgi:hypothetical protein